MAPMELGVIPGMVAPDCLGDFSSHVLTCSGTLGRLQLTAFSCSGALG